MTWAQNMLGSAGVRRVVVCALVLAGCNGRISFGTDMPGVGADARPGSDRPNADAVVYPDADPPDLGMRDGGSTDEGPADQGPADAAPDAACVMVLPASWPHARDKATYKTLFWDFADASAGRTRKCSYSACHVSGGQRPMIVETDAALDTQATLDSAIDQLWSSILPRDYNGATRTTLQYSHYPVARGGIASEPEFTMDEITFYDALVEMSKRCQ